MLDPYLYPGTQILRNKFDIRTQEQVNQMEAEFVSSRMREEIQNPIPGSFGFDHLCQLHFYMFQDIYDWAGQPRIINMEKPEPALGGISIEYSDHYEIPANSARILQKMNLADWSSMTIEQQSKELSRSMADLWRVHSFREGNTRTAVTFCCHFAESKGMPLEMSLFEKHSAYVRTALVAASAVFKDLGDRSNPAFLERIVLDSLQQGLEREKITISPRSIQEKLITAKAECDRHKAGKQRIHKKDRGLDR